MRVEVYEALRSIGIADDKAARAAEALAQESFATTLKADMATLKNDFGWVRVVLGIMFTVQIAMVGWVITQNNQLEARIAAQGAQIAQMDARITAQGAQIAQINTRLDQITTVLGQIAQRIH